MKRSIRKKRITGTQSDWDVVVSFIRPCSRCALTAGDSGTAASCVGGWQDVEWRSESAAEEDEMLSVLFRRHSFYPGSCLGRGPAVGGGSGSLLKLADLCSAALTRPPALLAVLSQSNWVLFESLWPTFFFCYLFSLWSKNSLTTYYG